jgi:hypothetical protein
MTTNEQVYIDIHRRNISNIIATAINDSTLDHVVKTDLYGSHVSNKKSASFQRYYFTTINNEQKYYSSGNFFNEFKKQYSLQGIDNAYLAKLESRKKEILQYIREDKLAQLYFDVFKKSSIMQRSGPVEKDLGSFFAKLVHTFKPDEYCALDNPIKDYFGLKKESFFIAFSIVSAEYKKWATDNAELMAAVRKKFIALDSGKQMSHELLSDLKILDLIFWSKANITEKIPKKNPDL